MQNKRKAFTIIELLTVILIISLLATFVAPRMFKGLGKAKRSVARSKMAILEKAIGEFQYDCGRFPAQDEGFEVLLVAPSDLEERWGGPYLKQSDLIDPWENPYIYIEEGVINSGSYDIISYGADGIEGGDEGTDNEDIYND